MPKGAAVKIGSGTVEVKTGVNVHAGAAGSSTEAYSLTYTGDDASKMHWMQFIWREVIQEFPPKSGKPSKPMEEEISHSGRSYRFTTDAKPVWQTDSATRKSPFYEQDNTVSRKPNELTMVDFPSSEERIIVPLFKDSSSAPARVVSHFHATTYLIRNMDVVYRADIDLTWTFTSGTQPPVVATVKVQPADHIESEQRARLISTDPDVDFVAGAKTDTIGEFAPVTDLHPAGSLTDAQWADPKTSDAERFADIVKIAQAEWINEVSGVPANSRQPITITALTNKTDAQPGLNYVSKLGSAGEAGETGYIDGRGHYVGRTLPLDPLTDPLPRIAIILGAETLKQGKAVALETLRHELRHATHYQLAIGWLSKWRGAAASKTFSAWLAEQHKAKKISDVDFDVMQAGLTTSSLALAATEVLAYTEGIVTGLPFVPPQPDLSLIKSGQYPAPLDQLHLLIPRFEVAGEPVRKVALSRLHDAICQIDTAHRNSFAAWIQFLQNPASLKATTKEEEDIQTGVTNEFKGHESFLKQLLAAAQKPCKRI